MRTRQVSGLVTLRPVGPLVRRDRNNAVGRMAAAGGHDVSDGGAKLPRLLQREDTGRIRSNFCFRWKQVAAYRLDDEIGSDIASSRKPPICLALAECLNPLDKVVALGVRVERYCSAEGESRLTTVPNRVDGNDLSGSINSRALNGGQSNRTGAQNDHIRAGLDTDFRHGGRQPAKARVVQHRKLDRWD